MTLLWIVAFWAVGAITGWELRGLLHERKDRSQRCFYLMLPDPTPEDDDA